MSQWWNIEDGKWWVSATSRSPLRVIDERWPIAMRVEVTHPDGIRMYRSEVFI